MNVSFAPQVNPVYNKFKNHNSKPSFTSNVYKLANGQAPHFTYFFRGDLKWRSFAKYLGRKYKDAEKVNLYMPASSDGTEAAVLRMVTGTVLGEKNAAKFWPINGFDIAKQVVNSANSGEIPLLPMPYYFMEKMRIMWKTRFKNNKYIDFSKLDNKPAVRLKESIKKDVNFKWSDFLYEIPNIESKNSVVMCRNMWMYLSERQQEKMAKMLGDKLDKSSICVLGEYDLRASNAVELLKKYGFEETYVDNVYEKMYPKGAYPANKN